MNNNLPEFLKKNSFYVYSFGFLLVWLTFFDGANLITQFKYWQKLKSYESQIEYYDEELVKVKAKEKGILNNLDALEKFGREKYLMKKEGETVFVLVDEDGDLMEEVE
ncbi:septum formation initiator family protein [uncultured Arcticibacterium sp.]|uniref:FtsB family cell division protein n=1 Tax=uncultured Arcticibacterium sp. TaxID=2173042 RepID=UPI0030F80DFD